jgi:hypothetical protein
MSQHLKSIVKNRLNSIVSRYIPNAEVSASHRRGVCYLEFTLGIDMYYGIMNSRKEGRHYNKHIIVRRAPRWSGKLHQLYTYHFPKTWSAACVANRELIKAAQKIAHALEHDHSLASLEWRLRFFRHYFRVVKGGAAPEPGMKAYSRFYQYTYVSIYRELKAAQQPSNPAQNDISAPIPAEDVSFAPISLAPRSFSANGIRIPFASQFRHIPAYSGIKRPISAYSDIKMTKNKQT